MQLQAILASLALAATALAAPHRSMQLTVGKAKVHNNCNFTTFLWHVDSQVGAMQTLGPLKGTYEETLKFDPLTGVAIKIATHESSLWSGSPVLHFSYTLNNAQGSIYYDLSSAFGFDPQFNGSKFTVKGSEVTPPVPSIEWFGGAPSGTKAYFGDTDLTLTLCA